MLVRKTEVSYSKENGAKDFTRMPLAHDDAKNKPRPDHEAGCLFRTL